MYPNLFEHLNEHLRSRVMEEFVSSYRGQMDFRRYYPAKINFPTNEICKHVLNENDLNQWSLSSGLAKKVLKNRLKVELQNLWSTFVVRMVELSDVIDGVPFSPMEKKRKVL